MRKITERVFTLLLCLAFITSLPAAVDAAVSITGDWGSFRGDTSNNAVTNVKTPQDQGNTVVKWKLRLTRTWGIGAPIIADNNIFIVSTDKLYKLDMNGKTVSSAKLIDKAGYFSYPAAGDGKIFIPVSEGRIQAFSLSTLQPLWVSEKLAQEQMISPVIYHDGCVYTGTTVPGASGRFICLDAETGGTIWKHTQGKGFYWCGGAITPNAIVFGGDDGRVIAHSLKDDAVIDVFRATGAIRSTAVYAEDKIFVASKDGYLYSIHVNANGTFGSAKKIKIGESTCSPVISGGKVYVGAGKDFYILNSKTLSVISRVRLDSVCQSSALVSTAYKNNIAYISYNKPGGGGVNAVVDKGSKSSVTELVNSDPSWCTASMIADKNGTLYYTNDSGYLFAVYTVKAPAAPKRFKVVLKSGNSLKMSWGKVSGADGYAIYRSLKKNGVYVSVAETKKLSYTYKKALKEPGYYYKVRAYKLVSGKKVYGGYSNAKKA